MGKWAPFLGHIERGARAWTKDAVVYGDGRPRRATARKGVVFASCACGAIARCVITDRRRRAREAVV